MIMFYVLVKINLKINVMLVNRYYIDMFIKVIFEFVVIKYLWYF